MSNYEQRVAQLERSLAVCMAEMASLHRRRRLIRRAFLAAVPLVVLGWSVMQTGAQTPQSGQTAKPAGRKVVEAKAANVVRASRFEVVDEAGKVLAVMGAGDGAGEISILNVAGKTLAKLGPHRNGSGDGTLATFSREGNVLVHVASTSKRDGSISTFNHDGKELVGFGANNKGAGTLITYNANGMKTLLLTGMPEGGLIVSFNDAESVAVKIGAKDKGAGIIEVIGADGNIAEIDPTDWPEDK